MAQAAVFSREELQQIRDRAGQMVLATSVTGKHTSLWKIAYLDLVAAADRLDAMVARSQVREDISDSDSATVRLE